jgi:hypothetical protein
MNDLLQRRGFLRGLAALPLIGGGVTLIGNPTKAAVLPSRELIETYRSWLAAEFAEVHAEMTRWDYAPDEFSDCRERFTREWGRDLYHMPIDAVIDANVRNGAPSGRAAVVMAAVGLDWVKSVPLRP